MPESWFRGLFDTALTTAIAPVDFLLCVGVSLALGLLLCAMTLWRSPFSRSLAVTLAILPAVVCVVIMMVNGNVGTGLITGMGYLGYGCLFTLILGAAMMLYNVLSQGLRPGAVLDRTLHITIPEDLDYAGVFDPILQEYTRRYTLTQVKTTNMGSLFKLTYDLTLKTPNQEKGFLDQLRLRNGNLEISLCHQDSGTASL